MIVMPDEIEAGNPKAAGFDPERLRRVARWLNVQIESQRLAGASVLVTRRGQVALFERAGFADRELAKPFARDTVVRIFSMTKPVTTVAAMMLFEEGCFQLDDPVAKYIPAFANTRVWRGGDAPLEDTDPVASPMTVRHLMTHTSGLTYGFMRANCVDAAYRQHDIEFPGDGGTLEALVDRLAGIPLLCQPGSAWNYSVSTDVLGRLVEVWSGQPLDTFFATRIFAPLDMRDAGFHVPEENVPRLASLYAPPGGAALGGIATATAGGVNKPAGGLKLHEAAATSRFLRPAVALSGGGGLVASMRDYAQFAGMLLGNGRLGDAQLLSPRTVAFMRQNHLPDHRDMAAMGQPVWSETTYEGIGFGLGWAVVLDPVKAHILTSVGEHHWGGAASTFFWVDPAEEMYVIFLTQLMPSSAYPIRRELRTAVYQAIVD